MGPGYNLIMIADYYDDDGADQTDEDAYPILDNEALSTGDFHWDNDDIDNDNCGYPKNHTAASKLKDEK